VKELTILFDVEYDFFARIYIQPIFYRSNHVVIKFGMSLERISIKEDAYMKCLRTYATIA
jgi:hypothetical protein